MSKVIRAVNVSKTFKVGAETVTAVDNISFEVERGEIFGIIGLSGAGKSTLVRTLNLLERPTSGQIFINDTDLTRAGIKDLRLARRKIGMIFQHFNLLMQRNIIDNVCFPMEIQKIKRRDALERAYKLLEVVGLSDKAKAYPSQLSGGQKQRVAIARALASNPEIILCDEATSALDPQTTRSVLDLLRKINEELGITIIVITHEMSVVRDICNRVLVLENGAVAENSTVDELFKHPRSQAAKDLLLIRNVDDKRRAI
ncbi:MAG: ATP-binding cassette domain-containing protein [Lachnospiraceae bacterium]|nr:ATP-binding cassette domain-containing protein [Lachnospiraceae bacterium]